MSESDALSVTSSVSIPYAEIDISYTRSSGPGGQHVNKTSTAVVARWNVINTRALTEQQRARVLAKLQNQINQLGELIVEADEQRSQLQNREMAMARLSAQVAQALHVPKPRRATRPSRASKERRLESKRQDATKKRNRHTFE